MGLDMYLMKSKRIAGMRADTYRQINSVLENQEIDGIKAEEIEVAQFAELKHIKKAKEFNRAVKLVGEHFHWFSIFEKVGYWRKANQIHKWFVDKCQRGVDECQYTIVSEKKLRSLLRICKMVVKHEGDKDFAAKWLPTQEGFFFGGNDIDEWYYEDVKNTVKILEKVLEETDFETEIIFYRSSW